MPRLSLPGDTTVSTKEIGYFNSSSATIEAVDVDPGDGETGTNGAAIFAVSFGEYRIARLELLVYTSLITKEKNLVCRVYVLGFERIIGFTPYDPKVHRWWRIRDCAGYLDASFSPNCDEWTTFAALEPNALVDLDHYRGVQIHISHRNDRGAKGPMLWDNLNVVPHEEVDQQIPRQRTMRYMGASELAGYTGAGVRVAILDQGVSNAVCAKMNATRMSKAFSEHIIIPPEVTPEQRENATSGRHGCLVAACFLPPGSLLDDIVIAGQLGYTEDSIIASGIILAAAQGAKVINCSYGGGGEQGNFIRLALDYAAQYDALVFFSSGNSGYSTVAHPAFLSRYFPNTHSVGAFDERNDKRAYFSQYDGQLTGVAPGHIVRGLLPDGTPVTWSGTSASSPHAARLAALLLTGGTFTASQVSFALKDTLRQPDVPFPEAGGGAFFFSAALAYLQPHDVNGGVATYSMPSTLASLRRAVAGRSGLARWDVTSGLPTTTRRSKSAEARVTIEAAVSPGSFAAQQLIYVDLGSQAAAIPQGKDVTNVKSTVELFSTPTVQRPRKHVTGSVNVDLDVRAKAYETLRWAPIPREAIDSPFSFIPTDLRFMAQDILTRKWLHTDLPIVDVELTWNLSGPFELTGVLAPPYPDIVDIGMDEWSTFIHVIYQDIVLGTGILQPFTSTKDSMTIEAVGISSYPHGIPYLETYSEFFPDTMDLIRELWRHVQSYPNGKIGVLLPTGKMGVPLFGDPAFDQYTGELLGYEAWTLSWTDFPDCGSLIDELAASTPFDYNEVHAWKKDKSDILHGINFGYPRLGSMRRDLRFVEGENIIEAVPIDEPDDAYASDVIVKGSGEGYNQVYAYVATSIWGRLRRVAMITDEKVTDVDMGNQLAMAELIRRLLSRGVSTIVVEAFHPHAALGTFEVGDDILIEAEQPWYGDFALWHRITSVKFSPETGLATLEVARSDSFRYGLWSWG